MQEKNPTQYLWTLVCFSLSTSIMAAAYGRKFFLYVEAGTILYCLGRYLYTRKSVQR